MIFPQAVCTVLFLTIANNCNDAYFAKIQKYLHNFKAFPYADSFCILGLTIMAIMEI